MPYPVQPLLPAVFTFDHQLDAVGQSGEDARRGGLEGDGFPLEVYPIGAFGISRGKHWQRQENKGKWLNIEAAL